MEGCTTSTLGALAMRAMGVKLASILYWTCLLASGLMTSEFAQTSKV